MYMYICIISVHVTDTYMITILIIVETKISFINSEYRIYTTYRLMFKALVDPFIQIDIMCCSKSWVIDGVDRCSSIHHEKDGSKSTRGGG